MTKKPMGLPKRAKALAKTLAKFEGRAFDWATGATCIHLVRTHLKNMGHKVPSIPRFQSAIGAKRALSATGHDSLESLLDAHLERIAPAMMIIGDIALMAGDNEDGTGFDAAVVSAGAGGKVFGWHPDAPALANIEPLAIKAAWRA